jgi:hypothetical protein
MNIHTFEIARILDIHIQQAVRVQAFIEEWFDDFRFSEATNAQLARVAREAQAMMADPRFQVGA